MSSRDVGIYRVKSVAYVGSAERLCGEQRPSSDTNRTLVYPCPRVPYNYETRAGGRPGARVRAGPARPGAGARGARNLDI